MALTRITDKQVTYKQGATGSVVRNLGDKLREFVAVEDFGADPTGTSDSAAAFALAFAESNNVRAENEYKIDSTITIPASARLLGGWYSKITISTDNVAILCLGSMQDLEVTKSGTHTKNLIEVGSIASGASRPMLRNIYVHAAGNDGIQVINGNLGMMENVTSGYNGRDGVNFTKDTVNNNAWTIQGFNDFSNNVRDGLNFEMGASQSDGYASKSHFVRGGQASFNGRYGVYSGTRSNSIQMYCEGNVTKDLYLDTYAYSNELLIVEGNYTNNGSYNQISENQISATYARGFTTPAIKIPDSGFAATDPYTIDHYIESIQTPLWTPAPTSLTVVGTPTYTGWFVKIGRFVYGAIRIQSTTTTASTAGTSYVTVPAAVGTSTTSRGTCSAINDVTFVSYGNGLVANNRIYFPTWAASADVVVSFQFLTEA